MQLKFVLFFHGVQFSIWNPAFVNLWFSHLKGKKEKKKLILSPLSLGNFLAELAYIMLAFLKYFFSGERLCIFVIFF